MKGDFFMRMRCEWANKSIELQKYHDNEWGTPVFSDHELFRNLAIQIFQSGLDFKIVLAKMAGISKEFDDFSVVKVAGYDELKIQRILSSRNVIRNERKVRAVVNNARLIGEMSQKGESFSDFLWNQVDFVPINLQQRWNQKMVIEHPVATRICNKLKQQGFKFVGPKNVSFFLQASGIINAHWINCEKYLKNVHDEDCAESIEDLV